MEQTILLEVRPGYEGLRADVFVALCAPELSRNAAQRLLEEGMITCEGKALKKKDCVKCGQVIELRLITKETEILPEKIELDVVYEDADIIVVNKPKGMVVHPAPGHESGTLVNALMEHCGDSLSGINGEIRPGIVHRIDKDTSGLIVCAKNDAAHRSLADQIACHSAGRIYEAVVKGGFKDDEGRVDAPIGRSSKDRKKMAVTDKNSRDAVTDWSVIERFSQHTYVRCALHTGRTHQIRVHMAYINHPVLGDTVYGNPKSELGLDSQCLHARFLNLEHPRTGEQLSFESPLPDYFEEVLRKLRAKG